MRRTVKEIRSMLAMLPDDMEVEFTPISDAWLGTSGKMRMGDFNLWTREGGIALPSDPGATVQFYLIEERTGDDT